MGGWDNLALAESAAGVQQVDSACQDEEKEHGTRSKAEYQQDGQRPAGTSLFAGLRIVPRIPFFVRGQTYHEHFDQGRNERNNQGAERKYPGQFRGHRHGTQRQGQTRQVYPAPSVLPAIQIKSMYAESAENQGKQRGQGFVFM